MIFNLSTPGSFPLGTISLQIIGTILLSVLIGIGIKSLITKISKNTNNKESEIKSYIFSVVVVLLCFIFIGFWE